MDKQIEKKKWAPGRLLLIAGIALPIAMLLYIFVFANHKSELTIAKDKLRITEIKNAPFSEYIAVTGTVEPIQTVYLDLSDGGKVIEKFVAEGAFLKAGDPIVKLANPNLSLQVMSTQSGFLQAESLSRQTRLTFEQNLLNKQDQLLNLNLNLLGQERIYKNNKALFEKNMLSANEYDNSKEKYETLLRSRELLLEVLKRDSLTLQQLTEQSESNMSMSKSYLALVRNQLANLTVTAPISGQLSSLKGEIGQSVVAGYRMGQIDNIDSFKVRAEIDEHYIARVRVGQIGSYEMEGKVYSLIIKTIYPQVANGRFYVDMLFSSGKPKEIRRGQTVHVKLQLGGQSDALLVENGGFYSVTGGQWLFVVDKSGRFAERRQIRIGRQNPQYYEVLEGLRPGELVITSSYDNFSGYEKLVLQ